jgi:hypothetical protein
MKKHNKNFYVFILAAIFVVAGYGLRFGEAILTPTMTLISDLASGDWDALEAFTSAIDDEAGKKLSYHGLLMDLDSIRHRLINTEVIEKDSDVIVRSESGALIEPIPYLSDEEIGKTVASLDRLCDAAQKNGAQFLYVAAPNRSMVYSFPDHIEDYSSSNHTRYVQMLQEAGIPTLDLAEALAAEGLMNPDSFFLTDSHWKPTTAFWAAGKICETLGQRYGFAYNQDYTDLNHFQVTTYENWFLGNYGKKTGRFFAAGGAEDIDLITPAFPTDFTESQPYKKQERNGSFTETLLYMSRIENKDHYSLNPYAAYSGGDFKLQIIRNHKNPNGKKIILVRDSYACAVMPFLALQASEIHVLDMRDYTNIRGERINLHNYIEQIQPDYVIALYRSVTRVDENGKHIYE